MSSSEHRKPAPPSFAALVQSFFAEHLTQQRALSPQTVAAYRDAFVLFLDFAQAQLHKTPTTLSLADLTPALILDFLDHLERDRHNTVRSRNARLAALRSFLKFAARRDVPALQVVEQALRDMGKGRLNSVLGAPERLQARLVKLLPVRTVMSTWCRQQGK